MCHVFCLFGNLSCFWSCACQPFDFGVQAFASNIQQLISRQASEAVPVTFLANLLYSCAKLPLYPHVSIRVDPELVPNEFWNIFKLFWVRSEWPRKKGLGGFSSDLKPDLFPPWKRLSYEWNFGVRKCLWSPKFPTSNMVVNSYTPAGHACQDL